MRKTLLAPLTLLVISMACKTSTNPLDGEKLRLISSNQDTTGVFIGPVNFNLTVLDPSSYGVSGAYIDFFDPIENVERHLGPTPADGTLEFSDTVASASASTVSFTFTAQAPGAVVSIPVELWVEEYPLNIWDIDSVFANSVGDDQIGVKWIRSPLDKGTDTVFYTEAGGQSGFKIISFPTSSTMLVTDELYETDTISIHNAYQSSKKIVWAGANYFNYNVPLYELADTESAYQTGYLLSEGAAENFTYVYELSNIDLVLAADPASPSGLSIMSPSLTKAGANTTVFYRPEQVIASDSSLQTFYYPTDLRTYTASATPLNKIPLPDSSAYSTHFIAVTQSGNYAQVEIGPISQAVNGSKYVAVQNTYQSTGNLPYAGRGHKR